MNTKLIKILLAGAVVAFGFSMRVMANPVSLVPGASVSLVLATNGPSTIVASETDSFAGTKLQGTVKVSVLQNFTDNPWSAAGGLTFVYTIHNSGTSTDAITGMGIDGWAGFLTDVADYPSPSFGPAASFASRSTVGTNNGNTVTFGWQGTPLGAGLIVPNSSGYEVLVYTNATSWMDVTAGVRDGDGVSLMTLGPAVPDGGTTALLLGLGLLGVGFVARRFKSVKA